MGDRPLSPNTYPLSLTLPRGVTGNTSDSGSEESWFEPRRGNRKRGVSRVFLLPHQGLFTVPLGCPLDRLTGRVSPATAGSRGSA